MRTLHAAVLAVWLAVGAWALTAHPVLAQEVRGHEWQFDGERAAALASVPETLRSPFAFSVVGALWVGPAEPLEVRVRSSDGAWGPWTDLQPEEDLAVPAPGMVPSRLLFIEEARELQVRAAAGSGGGGPGLGEVRIVAIDPGVGGPPGGLQVAGLANDGGRRGTSPRATDDATSTPGPVGATHQRSSAFISGSTVPQRPVPGTQGPGRETSSRATDGPQHSALSTQHSSLSAASFGLLAPDAQIVGPPPVTPEPAPSASTARPTLSPAPSVPRTTPTPSPTPLRVAQPRIVSRVEWGADPAHMTWPAEYVPVRKFVIHHTATSEGGTDPAAAIRAIYYYHAVTLGWGDIGYSYIVDRSGKIYEGRAGGANAVAAHSGKYSEGSDGIAMLGTFHETRPPEPMLAAVAQLIAWRARTLGIDPSGSGPFQDRSLPNVFAHRDVMTTECPGDAAYALMSPLRQRAAALIYGPPPRASVRIGATRVSPVSLSAPDTVRVDVTLTNAGPEPLTTQGPEPGTIYGEGETFLTRGFPEEFGRIRVAAEVDGGAPDRRFRWGLGAPLAPGETRTVSGFIRFDEPGVHSVRIGVVQEQVDWLQDGLGQTSVRIYPPGASSYLIEAPSPALHFPLAMRDVNGWTTRVVLFNPGGRAASGSMTLTDAAGRPSAALPIGLPPRGTAAYDLAATASLGSSYVGAASVRVDGPVAAVAFHERPGSDRMAVEPVVAGSGRLYAPLVARRYNGLTSGIQVQNLGSAPTTVSVTYLQDTGATWTESARVAPLASATFYAPAHEQLPDGFVGSAIVESADGQPLAAQVNLVRLDGSASAYAAQAAGSSSAAAPLLYRRRNGWDSGLQVQDVGPIAATAVARFAPVNGSGGPWQQQATIGHALAGTLYLPANPDLPDDLVASATVQATDGQPLVLLANSVNNGKRVATSVGGLSQGGSTVAVPWVTNDLDGWRTGVQVQNLGGQPAPVSLTFFDRQGTPVARQDDVIPGASARTYYAPGVQGLPAGFTGSLVVSARGPALLSAVVNDVR